MQVEALVQADGPAKPDVGFLVSGWAAEPMRTPPKRASYRSGQAGDYPRPGYCCARARILAKPTEIILRRAFDELVLSTPNAEQFA